jgi:N-acyl homoserine lactone hydrolase
MTLVFLTVNINYSLKSYTGYTKSSIGPSQNPAVRLYVFDGGTLENMDTKRFGLEASEVAISRMSVPCFLVVHPKGTLIWDTGAVPDSSWTFTGSSFLFKLTLPNLQRDITLTKPLKTQLAELGYSPTDITYLALSHYHYDHTANANEFSNAIWLVRENERDSMFSKEPPGVTRPSTYSDLRKNKIEIITTDQYDVFGDGTVIIKSAPGHTPGHQILFLKLRQTGNIVLSGDLYHYPEERTLDRVPIFDFNQEQTRLSRKNIDAFLKRTNAQLWIQHDFIANSKLKKAPNYYE